MGGEMRQLVKTDQSDLRALPVVDRGVELEMRKLDLSAAWPAPFVVAMVRGTAEPGIEVRAFIPEPAGIGDLRCRAPEEYRGKARHPADIAQRLEDQPDSLPATCGTAVYADIGGGP